MWKKKFTFSLLVILPFFSIHFLESIHWAPDDDDDDDGERAKHGKFKIIQWKMI